MIDRIRRIWEKPTYKKRIGDLGEREAESLLKAKSYKVLARNWRSGKDEIDLICKDGCILVFVETRTRKRGALVSGYESISRKKRQALLRVCRAYLRQMGGKAPTQRFDIVDVEHEKGEVIVARHFENIPLFSKSTQRGI